MNFAQILARLENMNAEIFLARSNSTYLNDADRWSVTIKIKNHKKGMELKSRGSGADVEDALRQAWDKVGSIVNSHTFSQGFDIPLLTVDADVEREPAF